VSNHRAFFLTVDFSQIIFFQWCSRGLRRFNDYMISLIIFCEVQDGIMYYSY